MDEFLLTWSRERDKSWVRDHESNSKYCRLKQIQPLGRSSGAIVLLIENIYTK